MCVCMVLHENIENRANYARMKDSYAIEFISYDTWVQLLYAGRFEGAFYIFPFMCLNEAVRVFIIGCVCGTR